MTAATEQRVRTRAAAPARAGHVHSRRRRQRATTIVRFVIAVVVCVVMAFPFYWMVVVALSPKDDLFSTVFKLWPSRLTLDNFTGLFASYDIGTWFGNSIVVTVFVTVLGVVVNLLAGYAFAKLRFLGRSALFFAALATLVLPVQVTMVAQFRLVTDLGIYGTYWAVILPTAATATGVFLARQFILGIPDELLEAAKLDGAGSFRLFRSIVLPLCRPLIAVLVVLIAMATWNDFAWPLIALKQDFLFTLPIGLLYLQGQTTPDFTQIMALALIALLPMIVLFLVLQRYFVQGIARSGIR
ncbi:carbohydrate ABC transporter permease [Amnibacterium kyonggiense]|uniref:Carbohydrate ABC transporter membrane protein 2 (CUT1 family) n=1 Tax=Amnibacterium kyonggiense TaxID=595671 RepID=A0A4R7FFC2_9MICO|nr:carbohydrate ABC transporter permease [Amnibacterium kyonggiense]TDS74813.1 carbohydrate ABC transporter membrane protein 2 (CUT1 family) [Amnibacterium kyonggiense]